MKLFRLLAVLWACAVGVAQSTQVQINVATKAALAAVTVQTWQTNLTAVTVDDGMTWQFQPSAVIATNALTVLESVGVAGRWQRLYFGPTVASWAGTGNWASDAKAAFDAGLLDVLVEAPDGVAATNIVIPANGRLTLSPNQTYNITNHFIQLAGDNAQLDGVWSHVISDQSSDTNYAAVLIQSDSGDQNMQHCVVRNLYLTGNGVAETPSDQEGYGIRVVGAKRFFVEDVNVNLFRNTSDTCTGIQILATEADGNCNRGNLTGILIGNCDTALELRSEGPTYICGYHTITGLKIDSEVRNIVFSADATAVAAGHGPGYNKIYGCFIQYADTTGDSIEILGSNNEIQYYADGVLPVSGKNIWLRGGTGNFFRTPSSASIKVESGASGLLFSASSIVPLGNGNGTYQINPHADLAGGNKDMTFTLEAVNTNSSALLRMIGHNNTGAQSPDWRLMSQGSSSAPHFSLLQSSASVLTNTLRTRFYNGGGQSLNAVTTAPTPGLFSELLNYPIYNGTNPVLIARNAGGTNYYTMYAGIGATAPTITYPGQLWISNAVLPTINTGSAVIALGTVDVGTAQITGTNSVVTTAANKTRYVLDPTSDLTLNNTGQVSDGYPGQVIYLYTTSGEANTVTFQDQGTVTGSNLELGAATRTVAANDVLVLLYNGTDWIEVNYQDN